MNSYVVTVNVLREDGCVIRENQGVGFEGDLSRRGSYELIGSSGHNGWNGRY